MTAWTDPHSGGRNGGAPSAPPQVAPAPALPDSAEPTLATLCEAVTELAERLPGPVNRLSVRAGRLAVEIELGTHAGSSQPPTGSAQLPNGSVIEARAQASIQTPIGTATETVAPQAAHAVRSPLVGTFYAAPSPGSEPFVRVGDRVEPGQQVGIVEAMKLMNAIVTDQGGTVLDTPAGDGESVEYDQPLVLLHPDHHDRAAS